MNIQVNINLCRVCMKSEAGASLLNDTELQVKFEFVTNLRIKNDDSLPAIICQKCTILLHLSHKFIQSAQETEKKLKTFLAKINSDFKLVTKNTPAKSDDILDLLDETDLEDISSKEISNINSNREITTNDCDLEEETNFPQFNSYTIDDDDFNSGRIENETAADQSTDYIESSNDLRECTNLDCDIMEEGEDTSQLECNEGKDQQIIRDENLFERYESLLEDDTSTMDILYEDNTDVLQSTDKTGQLAVSTHDKDTTFLKVELQRSKATKNETTELATNEAEATQSDSEEKSHQETRKWSSRVSSTRKINSPSVADSTRYYCSKCNRDFSTRTNLTRHIQLHDGNRKFQCNVCFKSFSQNSTLKQHTYIHTGEKPHICHVCKRGFTQSKSLVYHMRRHTGDKPHQCDYCGSLFRQKDALKVHILKHHTDVRERNFACKICNKEMNGQELRSHMKMHLNNHKTLDVDPNEMIQTIDDGELVYFAEDLSLDLDGATHVIDVMATSTTEPSRAKKYQCRTCFKCFAIKKNLIRHLSFHDLAVSSLQQCQTCDLVFDTNYALKVHRVRDHKDTNIDLNECDECQIKFQNATELCSHLEEAHSFHCSQCPRMYFASEKHLSEHLLEHHIDEIEKDS